MALELLALQSEILLDPGNDALDDRLPLGVLEREAVRLHPPDAPDARVDEGLLPFAVGGLMTMLDQFLRRAGGQG